MEKFPTAKIILTIRGKRRELILDPLEFVELENCKNDGMPAFLSALNTGEVILKLTGIVSHVGDIETVESDDSVTSSAKP